MLVLGAEKVVIRNYVEMVPCMHS